MVQKPSSAGVLSADQLGYNWSGSGLVPVLVVADACRGAHDLVYRGPRAQPWRGGIAPEQQVDGLSAVLRTSGDPPADKQSNQEDSMMPGTDVRITQASDVDPIIPPVEPNPVPAPIIPDPNPNPEPAPIIPDPSGT
jgi:hypothetical protein